MLVEVFKISSRFAARVSREALGASMHRAGILGSAMKANTTVTVVGVIYLGLGLLASLSATMSFVAYRVVGVNFDAFPVRSELFDFFWKHYQDLALAQIVLGIVVTISAFMFLRRKRWARVVLQAFAGLNILWALVFTPYWIKLVHDFVSLAPGHVGATAIRTVFTVMGILVALIYCGAFVTSIVIVAGPKVRSEFAVRRPGA